MKKLIFILIFLVGTIKLYSQNISLLQRTWIISELTINDVRFEDVDGTCVYDTELTMFETRKYITVKPCSNTYEEGIYSMVGEKLFINDKEMKIITLTNNNLTLSYKTNIKSDDFNVEAIAIIKYVAK